MPTEKDLKRRVRARMAKTGEAYTVARAQLLKRKTSAKPHEDRTEDLAAVAGMSDEAVAAKTGRDWSQWKAVLDRAGAARWSHRDIAWHLQDEHDLPGWWAQTVTVSYERFHGLREKGQRRSGTYDVSKSKTVPVPVATLYAAFDSRRRKHWLGDAKVRVKKATPERSIRMSWTDGTPVDVTFWEKGPSKSQVQIQHGKLPTREAAEGLRDVWGEKLALLAAFLTG